ncbi:MAG TPA: hypothetical protein ENL27_00395 [Candidatus Parcubacteria bacterium]|nr:hypothetical protein [Candidatus Parcubacteria bacterium]
MPNITLNVIRIFFLGSISFIFALLTAPALTHFLYKHKLWRKKVRHKTIDGKDISYFKKFHSKGEVSVPRFGGLLIWGIPLALSFLLFFLSKTNIPFLERLNFLSRSQTWLPLFALVAASLVGLLDDILQVSENNSKLNKYIGGGLRLSYRLAAVSLIGLVGGWWFYFKLGYNTIHIPGDGDVFIGWWYIPLFVLVMLATYSGGVIDGLDGLAGGVFAIIFAAFGGIALFNGQYDLAAFCVVVAGAILAFLWFNIPPARFYMGETGTMGICAVLTVISFLTDSVLVLPIIAFLLAIESGSVIVQLFWKKFFHKKFFLAAPIHHHFEVKGWPHYKITMRFWVIGAIAALVGLAIRLLG